MIKFYRCLLSTNNFQIYIYLFKDLYIYTGVRTKGHSPRCPLQGSYTYYLKCTLNVQGNHNLFQLTSKSAISCLFSRSLFVLSSLAFGLHANTRFMRSQFVPTGRVARILFFFAVKIYQVVFAALY